MPGKLVWPLVCLAIAWLGTGLALRYALARGLLDQPGERRSHAQPTPRGGGVSIVLAMLVACVGWGMARPEHAVAIGCLAAGLLLVAGVGWVDDHRPLSPWPRLAAHGLAALVAGWAMHLLGANPPGAILTALACLILVNAWNFMDGIDGLAATQALACALGIGWLAGFEGAAGAWALAIAASSAGFLPYNIPKARIFLGDVGSGSLGYVLGVGAGLAMLAMPMGQWPLLLLPACAFLVDTSLTLLARMVRDDAWWTPHVEHAYQRLSRRWGSHMQVTLAYGLFTIMSITAALFVQRTGRVGIIPAVLCGYLSGAGFWYLVRKQTLPRQTGPGEP